MARKNISSGASWESVVGYSRAVRIGNMVAVSGTVATDENGQVQGEGNMYLQTKYAIQKIEKALAEAGASLGDVIRTRMYVADISLWEGAGKAHAEYFGEVRPASTMVEVSRLIAPEYLIEIEVDAVIED